MKMKAEVKPEDAMYEEGLCKEESDEEQFKMAAIKKEEFSQ